MYVPVYAKVYDSTFSSTVTVFTQSYWEMKNATAKYYQHLQNGNNTLKPKTVFSFVVLKAGGNPQKICSRPVY